MRVRKPLPRLVESDESSIQDPDQRPSMESAVAAPVSIQTPRVPEGAERHRGKVEKAAVNFTPETVDYSNSRVITCLSYVIWSIVLVANVYAIVMIGMGKTGR